MSADGIWPVVAWAVLFALELLYLSDYDRDDGTDRVMIIVTVAVSGSRRLSHGSSNDGAPERGRDDRRHHGRYPARSEAQSAVSRTN
jgi:hypothetical protein